MSYKNLEVWQLAREVVIKIHKMSLNELPKFELYETGSQIRRSSKSVKSNIVEGYGRRSYKQDFVKFLIYSLSSNDETLDHLETLFETESFTNKTLYIELHSKVELLGKKLNKFIQSVEKGHNMYSSNNEPEKLFVKNPESISQHPSPSFQHPVSSNQHPESRIPFPDAIGAEPTNNM